MPETSPELAARIDSLRASHAENPARFFMPLASALREAGETGKAEELLRENLKRHPGYLSAHVLLGRCLADRGAYAEARNEFQYVLSVDPQNLIALRTLGDMSATGGDPGEARRWYGELLSVDPMNTEARQALAALEGAPQPTAPAAAEARPATEQDGFGMVEIDSGVSHAADHPAAHADPGTWGELSLDEPAPGAPAPEAAPGSPDDEFQALDFGAVDLDAGSAELEPAAEAAPASGGFDSWAPVDDGRLDLDDSDDSPVEPLPLEQPYAEPEGAAGPAAHPDEHDEHGEVVTETIAELYARQGFPDRAAGVYRELIARRGQEPALVRRLEELEREISRASSAPAGEGAAFDAVDLAPTDEGEPAAAAAEDGGEPRPASTSWLETVDAVIAGTHAAPPAAFATEDAAADAGFAPVDLPAALDLPTEAAEAAETPQPAVAAAVTGDAFADSFANGFDGGDPAEGGRQEWEAPRVEETDAVPELASAAAFASTMEEAPSDEPSPAIEPAGEPVEGGHTIAQYLAAILGWRPAAPAAASPSPESPIAAQPDTGPAADEAPPAGRPWDEETLGAAVEQPPMDEPWIAGGPAVADQPADEGDQWTAGAAGGGEAVAPEAVEAEADEPWAAPAVEEETPGELEPWGLMPEQVPPGVDASPEAEPAAEPWAADEAPGDGEAAEDLPWLAEPEAGTEPAAPAQPSAGDQPMPWELAPEVPVEPAAERPAPRQEPTVEPAGGFSFEDFFAERPAEAEPAPVPGPPPPEPVAAAPAPPPPGPAATPPQQQEGGGEEDEDLESFQAWLQSLKR